MKFLRNRLLAPLVNASLLLTSILILFISPAVADTIQSANTTGSSKLGVGVPYSVDKVDPLNFTEPVNLLILANISRPLIRVDSSGATLAALAWSFSISPDRREWSITTREEVTLPSGRLLLPEDMVKSLEFSIGQARDKLAARAALVEAPRDAARPSPPVDSNTLRTLDGIDSVRLVTRPDPLQLHRELPRVVISLKPESTDITQVLSRLPIFDVDLSASFGTRLGQSTLLPTVGPYMLRNNTIDQGIILERNSDFFEVDMRGSPVITVRSFVDANSALSALRTGGIDMIFLPTSQLVRAIQVDSTLEAIDWPESESAVWKYSKPLREYWSQPGVDSDRLLTSKLIVRKGLKLDKKALENFDLSGSYLP